jgi:hypothetical protein
VKILAQTVNLLGDTKRKTWIARQRIRNLLITDKLRAVLLGRSIVTIAKLPSRLAEFGICLIFLFGFSFSVLAEADRKINKDEDNIAILGYDPVAYFTEGGPVEGKEEFSYIWQDAGWRFSTTEHREMFAMGYYQRQTLFKL